MRNPLSLEAFADWLEQQPADKVYNFTHSRECALTEFIQTLGLSYAGAFEYTDLAGAEIKLDHRLWEIANPPTGPTSTFGAAAKRARELLRSA